MKQNIAIIGFLLVLLAIGLGLAYLLPVKAAVGVVITLQLLIFALLSIMTMEKAIKDDKADEKPAGRKRNRKNQKPQTDE